jgi:hypothetical protein
MGNVVQLFDRVNDTGYDADRNLQAFLNGPKVLRLLYEADFLPEVSEDEIIVCPQMEKVMNALDGIADSYQGLRDALAHIYVCPECRAFAEQYKYAKEIDSEHTGDVREINSKSPVKGPVLRIAANDGFILRKAAGGGENTEKTYNDTIELALQTFPIKFEIIKKEMSNGWWHIEIHKTGEIPEKASKLDLHFEIFKSEGGKTYKVANNHNDITVNLPPDNYLVFVNEKLLRPL